MMSRLNSARLCRPDRANRLPAGTSAFSFGFQDTQSVNWQKSVCAAPALSSASVRPTWCAKRRGFSLPEMLIVLTILAAMAAFTLPAMRGPLDKSRLRSSATSVKTAIAKARATAIRRGSEVSFHYELNGNRWKIEASGSKFAPSAATSTEDTLSEIVPTSNARELIREGRLPDGCVFISRTPDGHGDAEIDAEENPPADVGLIEANAVHVQRWTDPIIFRPHGRSHNAQLSIRGNRDFAVTVDVRGLTGNVAYSSPFRLPASEMPTLSDEVVD